MMDDRYRQEHREINDRMPEARYAYYRRCQVFRKGGEQCKAPAEKGSHICHAHAGQLATAVRREKQRRAVLAAAVAQMRSLGKPKCEMADLFMDFKGIQTTLAVAAQALIAGRIDCKTAGRLVVELQTFSKLLRLAHRKGREGRKEKQILPQICAEERRFNRDNADLKNRMTAEKPNLTTEARRQEEKRRLPQTCTEERRLDKPEKSESRLEEQNHTTDRRRQEDLPLIHTDDTDVRKTAKEPHVTAEICVAPNQYWACRRYRRKRDAPHVLTGPARSCQYRRRST